MWDADKGPNAVTVDEPVPVTRERDPRHDAAARERLILEHMPLVHALARRYARSGEPIEDLVQVGTEGLIKAVDRFDATRGNKLATFATPTILGEIRRHFRDRVRVIHVPRALQEAQARVSSSVNELTSSLGRSPTVGDIADHSGLSEDEVLDAMAAASAFRPMSLSRPAGPDDELPIEIGVTDDGFGRAEGRAALGTTFSRLPAREQQILILRFREGLTQSEIAGRVGISQMHVSRLIRKAIVSLRGMLGEGTEATTKE